MLRLLAWRVNGDLAAVHYGLCSHGRAYSYITGFDPRFRAINPRAVMLAEAVKRAIDEGATAFDFLAGHEPYKYDWGARDVPASCFRVSAHQVHD
jgi:CelD/BcsL family acetyltransferase involved in cellulose biosynthesis